MLTMSVRRRCPPITSSSHNLPTISIGRVFLLCAAIALLSTIFIFIEILSPPPPPSSAGSPFFVIAFGPTGSGKSSSALRRDLFERLLRRASGAALSPAHRAESFADISVDTLVEGSESFQSRMRDLVVRHHDQYAKMAAEAEAVYWDTRQSLGLDDKNDRLLYAAMDQRRDIVFETTGRRNEWVCSTLVPELRRRGFGVHVVYPVVNTRQLRERVLARFSRSISIRGGRRNGVARAPLSRLPNIFARGGRMLAEATVHAQRSLAWMAQRACMDSLHVYDNSGRTPRHVAAFEYGPPTLFTDSNSVRCALVNAWNFSENVRDANMSCARDGKASDCCLPDAADALSTHACGWSHLKQRMSAQCSRLE